MTDPDQAATPDDDYTGNDTGDYTGALAGLGAEQPEADVLDQRRTPAGPSDPEREPVGELTMEANEADVLDQHEVVPVDDREV